jgi:hypothetical protein
MKSKQGYDQCTNKAMRSDEVDHIIHDIKQVSICVDDQVA